MLAAAHLIYYKLDVDWFVAVSIVFSILFFSLTYNDHIFSLIALYVYCWCCFLLCSYNCIMYALIFLCLVLNEGNYNDVNCRFTLTLIYEWTNTCLPYLLHITRIRSVLQWCKNLGSWLALLDVFWWSEWLKLSGSFEDWKLILKCFNMF